MTRARGLAITVFLLMAFATGAGVAQAQELNCRASVDLSQISGSEYTHLTDLKPKIEEYLNDRSWTDDRFLEHERIECTVDIAIREAVSLSEFSARIVVSTRRPIYNTSQNSVVLRVNDSNWEFSYTEGEPLTHTPDRYDDLTSVLDFYAFLMLGYDYDTFSELGGTPYFDEAREIAEQAQGLNRAGWSERGGERSRAQLITELMDTRFEALRRAYFNYHFGGLDHFINDTETARTTLLEVLRNLQQLSQETSRSYVLDQFMTAKQSELIAIFDDSEQGSAAYDVLTQLDPSSNYDELIN